MGGAAGGAMVQALLACAVYPLLEEIVFRRGLLCELDARHPARRLRNNLLTSAAFGLAHLPSWGPAQALAVVPPSLLLGVIYQRTGSLALATAVHGGMNALRLGWLALTG